jgi:hypothetical protein
MRERNNIDVVEKGHSSCCGVLKKGKDTQE